MILRTPVIFGVCCWLIGINTAIPFRKNPKNIKQDIRHVPEDKETSRQIYQPRRRDQFNHEFGTGFRKGSDYHNKYQPIDDEYYNSQGSEIYPDYSADYPNMKQNFHDGRRSSTKLESSPNFRKFSQDYSSPDVDQNLDSTEDYSPDDSYDSYEDANPKDSTTSAPEGFTTSTTKESTTKESTTATPPVDSTTSSPVNSKTSARKTLPDSGMNAHLPEGNVMENWIPTNCPRSARKSSDRYSTSFVSNNTRDGLNEDTFPNPGEAEAVKRSSVFVGEDVTLCWIETITIKEDKSIRPPKKVVLREFTISFENSATIPEKYLECGKLEGELKPGCHTHGGKSGLFDVIDEDSKVSKLVNFTTVSNKGNIEVRQHKNVRCAVGPVVTKNVIEFKDGSKNPKKRVEVKVSPRLRRMSDAGEACPSDQEKIDIPPKIKPGIKDLLKNTREPKGESNELGKMTRKPYKWPEQIVREPGVPPRRIHEKPEKGPELTDKTPEEELHSFTEETIGKDPDNQDTRKFGPDTLKESTPHDDEEEDESEVLGEIADGNSSTHKNEIPGIENATLLESPVISEGDEKDKESMPYLEQTTEEPRYSNTRKALKPSTDNENTLEGSTTPKETESKEDKGRSRKPIPESCEGGSCEQCSAEGCSTDSQSREDSTQDKSALTNKNEDTTRKDKLMESSNVIGTSAPENDDAGSKDSTTKADDSIPTDGKPSGDVKAAYKTATEKHEVDQENKTCTKENCSTRINSVETEGPATEDLKDATKQTPLYESGSTTSSPETEQESENESESCKGNCSTVSTKPPRVNKKEKKTGTGKGRKSTTESTSNEEGKPSELISFPITRKSSSEDIYPVDVANESPASDIQESDANELGGRPTSQRSWEHKTDVADSLEQDATQSPQIIPSDNLIHVEGPEKNLECEDGNCPRSLEDEAGSTEGTTGRPGFPKDTAKASGSSEESLESPTSIEKSFENISKSPETLKESSGSARNTTKFPEDETKSTKDTLEAEDKSESTETPAVVSESPENVIESEAMTESPESGTEFLETTSEPEEKAEGISQNWEGTSFPRAKNTAVRKRNKKKRRHEHDDDDGMRNTYSDEEDTSHIPSFMRTTIPPSEEQPRESTERSDNELRNRSGEIFLERVSESNTDMPFIEGTTPQCLPNDEECNPNQSKHSNQSTTSHPGTELDINRSTPDIIDHKSVPKIPPESKHRLGLRIRILLEHINENEERKNLVEVDKHLLLNEDAKDHDNNTILNQIKALNDSVTAQTIKALLNCSTLENLTKKGISIEVDEAALVPKGKEGSEFSEPNEFILNVEDKGSDGEGVTKLRRKREDHEDVSKDDNSTSATSTEENFTDSTTADPPSTIENCEETTTVANHIEIDELNRNQSETIKDYLPDLREDINTGISYVISKLKNCTTLNCPQESDDVNILPISNILEIISDPQDSRINSRNKRDAEDYKEQNGAFETLDNWSNERIKRAAGGHHLRSLTQFTIFRET